MVAQLRAVTTQLCLSCANRVKSTEALGRSVRSQDKAHRAEGSRKAKHPGERIKWENGNNHQGVLNALLGSKNAVTPKVRKVKTVGKNVLRSCV